MEILNCFVYNQHFVAMMNIINIAKRNNVEGKFEIHHIIPRCYFKKTKKPVDNSENNLVKLTIEEHKKVHELAYMCAQDFMKGSLKHAYNMMHNLPRGLGCIRDEEYKQKISKTLKEKGIKPPSQKGKHIRRKPLTEEQKKYISERTKLAMQNPEIKAKCAWNKGLTKETSESVKAQSEKMKGCKPWNKR